MSLGYAEKLSYKEDVGEVGMKEYFNSPRILEEKIKQLALMIRKSKHLVVFTGAGISTACGIPDFRGPKGIWTLQREGRALPQASLPFHCAMPSMTHMALVELEKANILKFLISQNVDGLHLRSGIPRSKLAELHGNSFMEVCPSCGLEYFRDFEVESVGLKKTLRRCSDINCAAKLRDTVLDWEDELPSKEMNSAEKHCNMADMVLCLGTSLQITPACNLPMRSLCGGGKIAIVNLQKTPKDKHATLVIRGLVDEVIAGVMKSLNLQIAPFVRVDFLRVIFTKRLSTDGKFVNWTLQVASVHGQKASLPFIKTVEISFLDEGNYKAATLYEQPFRLKRRTERSRAFSMLLKLHLADGCGCLSTEINIAFDPTVSSSAYNPDRNMVIQELRDITIQELRCGTNAVIEKKADLNSKSETTDYAIVTKMVDYHMDSEESAKQAIENGDVKKRKGSSNGTARSQKRSKGYKHKSSPPKN